MSLSLLWLCVRFFIFGRKKANTHTLTSTLTNQWQWAKFRQRTLCGTVQCHNCKEHINNTDCVCVPFIILFVLDIVVAVRKKNYFFFHFNCSKSWMTYFVCYIPHTTGEYSIYPFVDETNLRQKWKWCLCVRSNNKCSKRLLNGGNGKRKNNNKIMRKELEKGKRRVTFNPHLHTHTESGREREIVQVIAAVLWKTLTPIIMHLVNFTFLQALNSFRYMNI